MTTETPTIANEKLTLALWDWLSEEGRLEEFADECLADDDTSVDFQILADWTEDTIRESADDLIGMVLWAACRLADWTELTSRVEDAFDM